MIYAPDTRTPTRLPEPSVPGNGTETEFMFEILARRKDQQEWHSIARFKHEDDVRASLWAVVFTSQYSAVKVRRDGATAFLAEWPGGVRL